MKSSESENFGAESLSFSEMKEIRGGFATTNITKGAYSAEATGSRAVASSAFTGETSGGGDTESNGG